MADFSNQTKLFFLSQIDGLRDPVRNTRWRVLVPSEIFAGSGLEVTNGDQFSNGEAGTDEFALHIKSFAVPKVELTAQKHNYMGFEQEHVVNASISGDSRMEVILLEDMRAYEGIIAWEQSCMNTGILVNSNKQDRMNQTGLRLGLGNHKDIANNTSIVVRNADVKVELFNFMRGDVIARYNLINAYPKSVDGFNLTYKNADLVNFNFTLHYDRWTVEIPHDYKTGL